MRQMLKANTRYFVGKIELDKHVDITDPMYDRSVWCRTRTQCKPGTYFGYVDTVDTEFMGNLIAKLSIYKDDRRTDLAEMEEIAEIGVDSGMAGFFRNKPDFSDDDYDKLGVITNEGDFWNAYDGIFSFSGCGDGSYPVYASKGQLPMAKVTGLECRFRAPSFSHTAQAAVD